MESLEHATLAELRLQARAMGLTPGSRIRKGELIALIDRCRKGEAPPPPPRRGRPPRKLPAAAPVTAVPTAEVPPENTGYGEGVLEIQSEGYGFLRSHDPHRKDVYLSAAQIRRFHLLPGDLVSGSTRPERPGERTSAMMRIDAIDYRAPSDAPRRRFDRLTPIYPHRPLILADASCPDAFTARLIDLMVPIGFGQRGLIVSPPKAGKTTLLKTIATAITAAHPEVRLILLLIDERPEEVTDMRRSVKGRIFSSTFDEGPENHARIARNALDHARRLVEAGDDVVLLMDSLTRYVRACNLFGAPSGRTLSGGLDPAALLAPKRLFGAARQLEEGGSLTILATALIDTGSRMDDLIYEEFKGTGNLELHLDRHLQQRRIFPAMDLLRSGTRREEALLAPQALPILREMRRVLATMPDEALPTLLELMGKTQDNTEFLQRMEAWLQLAEPRKKRSSTLH